MRKSGLITALCLSLLTSLAQANDTADLVLTPLELKWLRAGWPVLNYADEQQLPIDIVVQPVAVADTVPFAMNVVDGRCKLVLSMRNRTDTESILTGLPEELQATAIEAVTAHEVAHCWRYLNGMWHTVPAGFIEASAASNTASDLTALRKDMLDTRREEGFADLVGLAWTLRRHPQQYASIHAWFEHVRADQPVASSFHDTREWLKLAVRPDAFPTAATPFAQAQQVWSRGLLQR